MRRLKEAMFSAGTFALGIFLALASASAIDVPPTGKPINLFDGKDFTHFDTFLVKKGLNVDPNKVFRVHDGMAHVSGSEYGYFITKKDFENYYLRAEFKWGNKTYPPREGKARDSGILFHVVGKNKIWPSSIEFQIIEGGTGDILVLSGASLTSKGETKMNDYRFDRFHKGPWMDLVGYRDPLREVEKPHGEWNVVEMIADNEYIRYWVNGRLVNEGTNPSPIRGKILFQSEGAEIFFRSIELRPLIKE